MEACRVGGPCIVVKIHSALHPSLTAIIDVVTSKMQRQCYVYSNNIVEVPYV